ncbi:hypothetical protein HMN09_00321900 [Mycena chlorophos]|uniref:Uncharacterized protein n=1 Tax=Mycena chlorophos TaxID=658473 RepID=A0A8H6WKJ7_MYCCL|nr:hypothetical protein HMN09_00321900 [Mycena chlorophos]
MSEDDDILRRRQLFEEFAQRYEQQQELLFFPKPNWTFPHPFVAWAALHDDREACWGPPARTLAELRMYALSWAIRSKVNWEDKINDKEIMEKWRAEAEKQQESLPRPEKLTRRMIDFVLEELPAYARLVDSETGIQAGPFDAIWFSDRLLSDDLVSALRTEALKLEDVPECLKDWHPRSNGQVLDLVHPSLYPVVYGRTHLRDSALVEAPGPDPKWEPARKPGESPAKGSFSHWISPDSAYYWLAKDSLSENHCWLPSDFSVAASGEVSLVSPYINNLHPRKHAGLYTIIQRVVGSFVPLFERVLSQVNGTDRDLLRHGQDDPAPGSGRIERRRIYAHMTGYPWKYIGTQVPCIWGEHAGEVRWPEEFENTEAMHDAINLLPEAQDVYNQVLERSIVPYSLRGKTIQCIIKLANIHLTPEKSEYPGGSWHVEGMLNERIVASGIYYYDEENISESRLAFRVTTTAPPYHQQNDELCAEIVYGMRRHSQPAQDLGSIVTSAGRALAWPNIYQHRVAPFHLLDNTRHGHRKIMAIFLVDPSLDPIPSATTIPPQQIEWVIYAMEEAHQDPLSHISKLPVELLHLICAELEDVEGSRYISRAMAEAIRLDLMDERKAFAHTREKEFRWSFDMCEH